MMKVPETFFQSIVNNTGDVIWVITRDQERIVYINRDFSGVKKEKILEEGLSSIWPVMDIHNLERILDAIKKVAMSGEQIENIQTVHTNSVTGLNEYYLHTVIPIPDEDGIVSHVQIVSTEISYFINTQRTMDILNSVSATIQRNLLSKNLFKVVGKKLRMHAIYITIMLTTDEKTAHLAYTNYPRRKVKKALGLMGKERAFTGIPIEIWKGVMHTIRHRRSQFWDDPYMFLTSRLHDKSYRKNLGAIVRLLDMKKVIVVPMVANHSTIGSLVMVSGSLTKMDVPVIETFAAQFSHAIMYSRLLKSVRKLEGFLETIVDNTEEGIIVVDENGIIVSWNRAASRLLGYSKLEILGKRIESIDVEKNLVKQFQGASGGNVTRPEEIHIRDRSGVSRKVAVTAFPVDSGQSKDMGATMIIRSLDPLTR